MGSSMGTYFILTTVALSVTYLGFLLFSAFGLGAFKVAAPFIGTIILVFAAAHCLDRAQEAEDARLKEKAASSEGGSGGSGASKRKAETAAATPTVPRRRRVAD